MVICRNDGKFETLVDLVLEVERKAVRHVAVFVNCDDSVVKIFTLLRNVSSLDVYGKLISWNHFFSKQIY